MAEKIELGQAFYGNTTGGYQLLGITDRDHSALVEKICAEIGSPDGLSAMSPFLISVPQRELLFMFCCRQGAPDASGRMTLFFHVLYGALEECRETGIDAFALFRGGFFGDRADKECPPVFVEFPPERKPCAEPPFDWNGDKLAILSESPQNDLVESLLGDRVNKISWASFTFNPLSDFELYAISKFSARPEDRECRDDTGKLVASAQASTPSEDAAKDKGEIVFRKHQSLVIVLTVLLVLSVLFNIYWGCKLRQKTAPAVQADDRAQALNELAKKFPKEKIISDSEFEEMKKEIQKDDVKIWLDENSPMILKLVNNYVSRQKKGE